MKKIKYLVFLVGLFFLFLFNVNAQKILTCKYAYVSGNVSRNYTVTLNLNGDSGIISKVIYNENNRNTGQKKEEDVTNKIDSDKVNIKESDECPSYLPFASSQLDVGSYYSLLPGTSTSEKTGSSQCYNYKSEATCRNSGNTGGVACVWTKNKTSPNGGFCNVDKLLYVGCGGSSDIPSQVPALISFFVNLLKIATPIILIFVSIITLVKALAASKDDEIKKAQASLVKKMIAAVMVFFVIGIVQFIISKVAEDEEEYNNFSDCLNCFLNNNCSDSMYYKTVVGGDDMCTSLATGETQLCVNTATIHNTYYNGGIADSCNGEYFSNGWQPKSIKVSGSCYEVQDSGKKILVGVLNLDKELRINEQNLWVANGLYYYWNASQNKYIQVSNNIEVITPYYSGSRVYSCGNGYFTNGYQPKDINVNGACTILEDTKKDILVSTVNMNISSEQNLWKANGTCYYWNSRKLKYESVSCDTEVINQYYIGKKAAAGNKGYFTNGYQPKEIKISDKWYKLNNTNEKYTFPSTNLEGITSTRTQTKWEANGIYYYWDPAFNQYKIIN